MLLFSSSTMSIIQIVKKIYRKSRLWGWNLVYDQCHVVRVEKGLQVLANQGRKLSVPDSKKAEEYAREVLGSVDFAPWIKLYSAFRYEFIEGWIPDNYPGRVVCLAINGDLKNIGDYKTLSKQLLQTDILPDIAYQIRGSWLSSEKIPCTITDVKSDCYDSYPYVFLKKIFLFREMGLSNFIQMIFQSLSLKKPKIL